MKLKKAAQTTSGAVAATRAWTQPLQSNWRLSCSPFKKSNASASQLLGPSRIGQA